MMRSFPLLNAVDTELMRDETLQPACVMSFSKQGPYTVCRLTWVTNGLGETKRNKMHRFLPPNGRWEERIFRRNGWNRK